MVWEDSYLKYLGVEENIYVVLFGMRRSTDISTFRPNFLIRLSVVARSLGIDWLLH